jgi:hypothetical protein
MMPLVSSTADKILRRPSSGNEHERVVPKHAIGSARMADRQQVWRTISTQI